MPITKLPFAGGFYQSDSLPLSAQQCVNWYPVKPQGGALNDEALYPSAGINLLTTSGEGENRGASLLGETPYFVNGTTAYRLEPDFTLTALGTVEGTARVSLAQNGTQLMILVPGGKGYVITQSPDTFAEITDLDFVANGNPQHATFVDGYFSATTDQKKNIVSNLNDATTWDALDFGSVESDPDKVVAPFVYRNQLFMGGSVTCEGLQNIGGADFPFQRTGLFFDKGVYSPHSLVNASDSVFFIGGGVNESPAIWAVQGNSVSKVSTDSIESVLQPLTAEQLNATYAITYAQKGAYFVVFYTPEITLELNITTGLWNERRSRITSDGTVADVTHRVSSALTAYGKVLVGDSIDGRIGEMSPEFKTEYGELITRSFTTQPFQNNMQSFSLPSIELTMESGVGDDETTDPVIWMERSADGKTFKGSRIRPIGKVGEYTKRAIWRRNGRAARFEVLRFTMNDPVTANVLQLTADIV